MLNKNVKRCLALLFVAVLLIVLYLCKIIVITPMLASVYKVHGVDVSHYQGKVDWKTIQSQGIDFAYIKATEGSKHTDKRFDENRKGISETNILYGFYHFFSFESSGEAQARHFISTVGNIEGCLFPVVDVEYYGDKKPEKDKLIKELFTFIKCLEKEYGLKPIIYSTTSFYNKYLSEDFLDYSLWIRNVYFVSSKNWVFWQYTDKKVLDGYDGSEKYIDMNVFYANYGDLNNYTVKPAS